MPPQDPRMLEEMRRRQAQQQYYMGIVDDAYMAIKYASGLMYQKGISEPYQAYRKTVDEGLQAIMEAGALEPGQLPEGGAAAFKAIGGLAQVAFAPAIAAGQTARQSITEVMQKVSGRDPRTGLLTGNRPPQGEWQLSPEQAHFMGRMGEEGIQFFPAAQVIKAKLAAGTAQILVPEELAALEEYIAAAASKERRAAAGIKTPPPGYTATDFLQPGMKSRLIKDIADASEASLRGNIDESKRLFENIKGLLELEEISLESIPEILKKNNMTPAEFAQRFAQTISESGRALAHLSHLKRRLNSVFKDEPLALQYLNEAFDNAPRSLIDYIYTGWRWIENKRRALLVTQVATTMRNIASQAGRLGLASVDEGFQGLFRWGLNGDRLGIRDGWNEFRNGFNNLQGLLSRMTKKGRDRFWEVLEQEQGAMQSARLIDTTVHEAVTGKFTAVLNILNRGQEHFFRKIAFEAKMRQLLGKVGENWETVDPKLIPKEFYEQAVDYAMEMTFAASKHPMMGEGLPGFIKAWNTLGLTTVNPFPRFAFANALPFVLEHSPLGMLSAFKPSTIKKLAAGNVDEFARLASRGMIGTVMLDSAMRLRQSEYAGEKWYEIKIGEDEKGQPKVLDTRAFAPFSTYLFIAEAFAHPDRLKPIDYAQAVIGLNRIAGSGLALVDMIQAKTGESFGKQLQSLFGQYMASFAVPFRTLSDIYAGVDPDEMIRRDVRGSEPHHRFIFPFLVNIPKLSQAVPEKPSPYSTETPTKTEPIDLFGVKVPGSWWRQLTGLSVRTKHWMEAEADKIALDYTVMFPRTGVPEADRYMMHKMAPTIEKVMPLVLNNPNYKSKPDVIKRIIVTEIFRAAKDQARRELSADPKMKHLAVEISVQNLPRDYRKLLTELTGKDWETVEGYRKLIREKMGME